MMINVAMNNLPLPSPFSDNATEFQGPWIQPYLAKVPGSTPVKRMDAFKQNADLYQKLRIPGEFVHGFTTGMTPERATELAEVLYARGMRCGMAWGLDDSDPAGKGERMGRIAALRRAGGSRLMVATLADQEGAWDQGADDEKKSEEMYLAFEASAPGAIIGDQPWPIVGVHSGFPWRSTTIHTKFRAPQFYGNNWRKQWGRDAYEKFFAWGEREWQAKETWYRSKGLPVQPRIPTIQGYEWDLDDCVTCLVTYPACIMWSEWIPQDRVITAILARNALADRGFVGPRAVWNFQTAAKLTVDGIVGMKTLKKLGVTPYDSSNVVVSMFRRAAMSVGLYTPTLSEPRQMAA